MVAEYGICLFRGNQNHCHVCLYCYFYLVTELNGITDNVTKIQRQKSSTKFYNLINQNTVISNKLEK